MTAKVIAETLHVSRSTVQRALGGSLKVSEESKKRIIETARNLGYRPNPHARALVMSRQSVGYAVILTIQENRFTREALKGITRAQKELNDFGVRVSIHFMKKIDGARQARIIDDLVADSCKGIVLIAIDCPEVKHAIANGVRNGTSFVTLATDIKRSKRLCFVGQDNSQSGRVAGSLMNILVHPGEKVACFVGSLQFLGHTERVNGFRERFLESHHERDIVAVIENLDSSKLSERLARDLLDRHPNLRGIFVAGGGAEGVCKAVEARGLSGKTHLVTYDLVQSRRRCRDGLVNFVIDQDPMQEGYRALRVLNAYVMYGEIPAERQLAKIDIRIRDNVDS